ncbi:MAG: NTP transferase domain-containing protein [Alphaproteobacteria bacterium]|nr:NTP transferase domain-containing protein [Alphaproteobacteria bacterium]
MRYETISATDALGWRLAHSVKVAGKRLPKGKELSEADIKQLKAASIPSLHAFKLEEGDIPEDSAAESVALHVMGTGLKLGIATRGRCNLHATAAGLLLADDSVHALNSAGESITLATLPHLTPVAAGQLVATAKIIPYAVGEQELKAALQAPQSLSVAPFKAFTASLITTGATLAEKPRKLTEARLSALQGTISRHKSCGHTVSELAACLTAEADQDTNIILILGLSAISDRRDIVPAALEAAGGQIISLGMPVDPGNLLMLGILNGKTVLGLPGCARSPALNGLDWVLERFAAGLPVDRKAIANMGIGGLLKETPNRPEPRAPLHTKEMPLVQPVILAAGRSTRAGHANKLLSSMNGKAVIRNTVAPWIEEECLTPLVITGHEQSALAKALSGLNVEILHNPEYATGMASSLRLGIKSVPEGAVFACIALGDMPFVKPSTFKALSETANRLSEYKIFIPTFNGKRGNPVLWQRDMFGELADIEGDKGGRGLIHLHEELVCEVPVDDPGILIDLDTPEAMAQFGIEPVSS